MLWPAQEYVLTALLYHVLFMNKISTLTSTNAARSFCTANKTEHARDSMRPDIGHATVCISDKQQDLVAY